MHAIHHLHVHALLLIMHHCIHVETETPELEEGETEQDSRQTPKHSLTLFWVNWSICVMFVHKLYYVYDCLDGSYLMHYPYLI
jgi:hypothetical protein